MVKLHVILAQSEGGPEIDLVAGEVVARETFSILTITAVIRRNTIINLFLGRMNPQHADWLNAILPRIYVMNNNISADSLRAQNVDIAYNLCARRIFPKWTYKLCARRISPKWTYNLCARRILTKWTYNL